MLLNEGKDAVNAIDHLKEAISRFKMVTAGWGAGEPAVEPTKQGYLKAVEFADATFSSFFEEDDGAAAGLYGEHYKLIRAMNPGTTRPFPMVKSECAKQIAVLNSLLTCIETVRRLRERPGDPVILDTNCLMHYQRLDTVPWQQILGSQTPIRIVLPVLVIDELDNKKYTGSDTMAGRASMAIKVLREYGKDLQPGSYATLADGTTVEICLDDRGHRRKNNPDEELFDRALLLHRILGRTVTIVTGDFGMQLRADEYGLQQIQMPDKYAKDAKRRKAAEENGSHASGVEG